MDDLAVGRLITLARQRRQWRQEDLAGAAGVSRFLVAIAEAGALERLTVRSLRRIAAPLEIRLRFAPLWNGGEADRLRDRDHARLVELVTTALRKQSWNVVVEYTFSHYGERGSIDILAWHARCETLLVVEVKTRIYDVQALVAGVESKGETCGSPGSRRARLGPSDRGPRGRGAGAHGEPESRGRACVAVRGLSCAEPQGSGMAANSLRRALGTLVSLIRQSRWRYPGGGRPPTSSRAARALNFSRRLACCQPG